MDLDTIKTVSSVASPTIALVSFGWGLMQHRAKKRIGRELAETRRRGDAPFLRPSEAVFDMLYEKVGSGQASFWPAGSENVLCFMRDEAGATVSDGDVIVLVVENAGATARAVRFKLDGDDIVSGREPDLESSHNLQYLLYPYCKAQHGKEQRLTASFETENGVQDTHTYTTRHGFRVLTRIDPPLPR